MAISQTTYQLKLPLDLPEEESIDAALSTEDIRIRAEAARRQLEGGALWIPNVQGEIEVPIWYEKYLKLIYGGWPWRVAVLIAWLAMPKPRWPSTQDKLARNILGLTSDRQISVWLAKNPAIAAQVQDVKYSLVWDDLSDVLAAGIAVAKQHDYKGKGDREMVYKMAGILSDKIEAEINDKSGNADLSKLSWKEKLELAGLDNPEALMALKARLEEQRKTNDEDEKEESGNGETYESGTDS